MTYKGKDNLQLAIQLLMEIGKKVNAIADEKNISREEAAKIFNEKEDLDEDLLDFLHAQEEGVLQAIAIQESKNETKH